VVTSDFHLPRARAIFEKCFGLAGKSRTSAFKLSYIGASDDGTMDPEVLKVRADKERKALKVRTHSRATH
jgi:uncharacterized SAM-binding protein YcdF (DUF218 family)